MFHPVPLMRFSSFARGISLRQHHAVCLHSDKRLIQHHSVFLFDIVAVCRPEQIYPLTLLIAMMQFALLPILAMVLNLRRVDSPCCDYIGLVLMLAPVLEAASSPPYGTGIFLSLAIHSGPRRAHDRAAASDDVDKIRSSRRTARCLAAGQRAAGHCGIDGDLAGAAHLSLARPSPFRSSNDQLGVERFRLFQARTLCLNARPPLYAGWHPAHTGRADQLQGAIGETNKMF